MAKLPEGRSSLTDEQMIGLTHRLVDTCIDCKGRIEALEAKLEKAVEALEKVRAFVRDLEPYADQGHTLVPALHDALTTIAELKGEK